MGLIVGLCRYALPVLAFFILVKCVMTLLIGHPVNENYAYIEDTSNGAKLQLNTWETSIGKSKTCDIMLSYDVISRFHAVICRRVDGWYVFDTLSKNGTYVRKTNGDKPEKVEMGGMMIEDGNIICFSNKEYRFTITNDPVIRVGKHKRGRNKLNVQSKPLTQAKQETIFTGSASSASASHKQPALVSVERGTIYLLVEDTITIGSGKGSDIRIQNPTVSRNHAVISKNSGLWYISDKNSTNGTFVNGVRVSNAQVIRQNDTISISNEFFRFIENYR